MFHLQTWKACARQGSRGVKYKREMKGKEAREQIFTKDSELWVEIVGDCRISLYDSDTGVTGDQVQITRFLNFHSYKKGQESTGVDTFLKCSNKNRSSLAKYEFRGT